LPQKYTYRKPKMTGGPSTTPSIYGLREYVKTMNTLVNEMPKRIDRGRRLFLISMADFVRRTVQKLAPEIDVGGEPFPYAKHLRLALVEGVRDQDAVAIFFENQAMVLNQENMEGQALFFQPTRESPKWVNVLMLYGPWPSTMVPVPTDGLKARVVSRKARTDELKGLSDRLYARRGEIESSLRRAGAPAVKIEKTAHAVGIVVHEDVGYNILRAEFGYDGGMRVAHWRPALQEIKEAMPALMRRYLKYLQTGRETVFDLPKDLGGVTAAELNKGAEFAKALAPFSPKG
jgi:hypothetical protein